MLILKMNGANYLGLLAGFLTTIALLPQVVKSWKTKELKDISLPMFAIMNIGLLLWLIYGYLIGDLPLIFANGVSFVFAFTILILKIRYKE